MLERLHKEYSDAGIQVVAVSDERRYAAIRSVAQATAKVLDREHQSKISPKGHASEEYYALVHTPIPLKKAMQIPKAKQALDDEWEKLEKKALK